MMIQKQPTTKRNKKRKQTKKKKENERRSKETRQLEEDEQVQEEQEKREKQLTEEECWLNGLVFNHCLSHQPNDMLGVLVVVVQGFASSSRAEQNHPCRQCRDHWSEDVRGKLAPVQSSHEAEEQEEVQCAC